MKASILTIGDELLIGQVINTNAAFIAQRMNTVGVEIRRVVTVGDDLVEIVQAIASQLSDCQLLIITGGLGPTHDDVTKKALCRFYNTPLRVDEGTRRNIERILRHRKIAWSAEIEEQASVPSGATVIENRFGTAPGLLFEGDKFVVVMPGVPHEMEAMLNQFVVPFFQARSTGKSVLHRTLKTTGISESLLARKIGNVQEFLGKSTLAFLPSAMGVRLRITAVDDSWELAAQQIAKIEGVLRGKLSSLIYGVDDEELEEIVGKLLTEKRLRISVAESCTGGLIAHRMTNVPGSSNYFERGIIAYSNRSKVETLKISPEIIREHGAVSKETAEAMAVGIRELGGTDIGLSTTGIAGPSGGSEEKPVGLVWIAYSTPSEMVSRKCFFGEGRVRIKERAAQEAFDLVRRKVLKLE